MKIYTFNASPNTRVEILWSLRAKNRDKMFKPFIDRTSLREVDSILKCDLAIYPQKAFDPETLVFDDSIFVESETAARHNNPLIIDATSDSDRFLNLTQAHILRCGLYKSLQQPFETECPFWSNGRTRSKLDLLDLLSKGKKPTVSFCGTISSVGRLSQLVKTSLPTNISKLVLSQGKYSRITDIRITEGMSLQLREMALKILTSDRRIDTFFEITNPARSYYLSDDLNKQFLENLFVRNISKCDYVLCIRGTGNYSGRLYMALNAGRIPVVLDTDVVIPHEEKLFLVKVPVQSLSNIGDFIANHFEETTEAERMAMKTNNRSVFNNFLAPEKFLPSFLNHVATKNRLEAQKIRKTNFVIF